MARSSSCAWGVAVLLSLPAAAAAQAQAPVAPQPAPASAGPAPLATVDVRLSFNGGLVAQNFGRALDLAHAAGVTWPSKKVTVGSGDTVCGILLGQGYPAPCEPFYPAMRRLNGPTIDARILRRDEAILVPDLEIAKDRRTRVFAASNEKQALPKLQERWSAWDPQAAELGADVVVSYDAFQVTLAVPQAQVEPLMLKLSEELKNTSASPPRKPANLFTSFALSQGEIQALDKECIAGRFEVDRPYAAYASLDPEALKESQDLSRVPVDVVIIDTPFKAGPHVTQPALALGAGRPSWTCGRRLPVKADHAHYLTGFVGARPNGNGFVGLARSAKVASEAWEIFDGTTWKQAEGAYDRVAYRLHTGAASGTPLEVYLVAMDFALWKPAGYKESLRTWYEPTIAITETDQLFVVAAGQPRAGESTQNISRQSWLSPQNLGDEHNVLVVTACEACADPKAVKLWADANYSKGAVKFVHVAAPGGANLPGWLDEKSLGYDLGTSPASAFVAGVSADMIGAYPDYFTAARQVKERIQTTARPLPYFTPQGDRNPDVENVATGVVDPSLALLDPRMHWVRLKNGTWKRYKLRSATIKIVSRTSGKVLNEGRWLKRLVRTPWPDVGETFAMIEYVQPDPHTPENDLRLRYDVTPNSESVLETCAGDKIPLASVTDFLPAATGVLGNECAS